MTYSVYADYGYDNETLLGEFQTFSDAASWLKLASKWLATYTIIEIASFADDGEYIVHKRVEC